MCCHDPLGTHGPARFPQLGREPDDCCHSHADSLPANRGTNLGEPDEPEHDWTAQRQGQEDKLKEDIAEARAALDRLERPEGIHRHGFR